MRKLIAILLMLAVCCFAIWATAHAQSGGDANGSGTITMSDVVYTINYIFGGGPAPVACLCLQFDGKLIVDDTNWVRARVGDRVMSRGADWYYLTDNNGRHWIATPDTIQWGWVDDTLTLYWSDDWHYEWVNGNITFREYLDLRLGRISNVARQSERDTIGLSFVRVHVYVRDHSWLETSGKGK